MATHEINVRPAQFRSLFCHDEWHITQKEFKGKCGDGLKIKEEVNGEYTGSVLWRRVCKVEKYPHFDNLYRIELSPYLDW